MQRGRKPDLVSQRTAAERKRAASVGSAANMPAPEELDLSPEAIRIWQELVPMLNDAGVLRRVDALLLTELCEAAADAQRYRRELRRVVRTRGLSSPEAKRLRIGYENAMKLVLTLASDFGLTPVARLRLGILKMRGMGVIANLEQAMVASGELPPSTEVIVSESES